MTRGDLRAAAGERLFPRDHSLRKIPTFDTGIVTTDRGDTVHVVALLNPSDWERRVLTYDGVTRRVVDKDWSNECAGDAWRSDTRAIELRIPGTYKLECRATIILNVKASAEIGTRFTARTHLCVVATIQPKRIAPHELKCA